MFKQTDLVIIVGSAPSLLAVKPEDILSAGATVIAVNGAIKWLGRADFWFTLDPQAPMYQYMDNQVEGCHYVMCGPKNARTPKGVTRLIRNEGSAFGWVRAVKGLSEDCGSINTGNSGYGGLGLAYHMKPKKILVLGVDASNDTQVDGESPGFDRLKHLPELFESAKAQLDKSNIDVVFGSKKSNVKCFERMTPAEGLKWLLR